MRRAFALVCIVGLALGLSACAPQAPSYDEVVAETEDAMELIRATLPADAPLDDRSGEPFSCELDGGGLLAGEGQFWTGLWTIDMPADFDGKAYIDGLPAELGDDFTVEGNVIDVSFPVVRLRPTATPDILIDVTTNAEGEEPFVDIRAISRCGEAES